ncbi:aminopeptidase [Sphingomonas sp. Leaf357]|uniref:ABC transporter permease/M1 family aminopeptidase n=1 Tax=Sphingomonas sp. Leaf357 TaxID=1736350 RepID=UPI0006F50F4D|nr:M1 family aminopeptidase [Sphingomonas sp. Leaf357]KQS03861.1 aminopeptidase [Sphingomonas sp. Leaf357]
MFGQIARFELRYQLRNPVFWTVSILFFLLTFGSITIDQIKIGSGANIHKNAPVAIAQIHQIMSLFFMFVTTAFVANVIVRDDESGFGPMVRVTRVSKFDYLIARFLGAFVAASLAFAAVPLAIWLGSLMPWVDAETLGPNRLRDYAYAYFLLGLPSIFLTSAIFFAVATMTRSMMYSYLGVVVFLMLYIALTATLRAKPEWRPTGSYFELFGIGAFTTTTRYWTASEANAGMPAFAGVILWNRLIAIGVALVALVVAYARFSFTERGVSKRKLRRQQRTAAKLAATAPAIVDRLPPARSSQAGWTRLIARCRFEMALVFRGPAFIVLLIVGLFNTLGGLLFANEMFGAPIRQLTFAVIGTLEGSFSIIPLIIAIYYSGELVWRDRERGMHEIVDATSLPNWAYLVPKVLAVTGVLFATIVMSVIMACTIQLARGQTDLALGHYFAWWVLPMTVDALILAILAVFVQALSPNKYVGWAIMVVYLVATITLVSMGFEHPLYQYGSTGTVQLSDMNGAEVGGPRAWWLRLYWGSAALALCVFAHLLWRRGTETRLKVRLRQAPRRLLGAPGAVLVGALVVTAASGAYLYRDMDVINTYRTTQDGEKRLAEYEKKYLKYATLKQPSITDMRLNVALYPDQRRMEADGRYDFVNDTGAPLSDLHVRLMDDQTRLGAVAIPGARLVMDDADLHYRIYRFATPLAPGARGTMTFRSTRWQRGLVANNDDTRVVGNGTFLNNGEFAPIFGMSQDGLMRDRAKRRKYGLSAELRPAKLEDRSAQARNLLGNAPWVRSDITVSTIAGQVPVAPGRKVADTTSGGRRTARFVSTVPILAFFSVQSAAYAEKSRAVDGTKLTVFYDPQHAYNVDRMLDAMQRSLRYYRANFGPYQFDYARILEFPGYASFAQAFAGTIPYSERIGFIADTRDPDRIDYVSYVTAHELGHQYWGHQLVSADMQGGTMLIETMAQYSALMVMKHQYGDDKIRRFLKYELDSYLRSRGGETVEEVPLDRVENQGYIHYRKGSLVMYLLQDRLGEARVNAMLRGLLDRYRFKGKPYPRSLDLVAGFLSLARNPAERQLVLDLVDRITVYDLKAKSAETRRLPDGTYETIVTIDAAKYYASGTGVEKEAPLADTIDVGVFDQRPGLGSFAAKDVILKERRPIVSGEQTVRIVTKRKPAFAGVDPYNFYIDRNGDDNIAAVTNR